MIRVIEWYGLVCGVFGALYIWWGLRNPGDRS